MDCFWFRDWSSLNRVNTYTRWAWMGLNLRPTHQIWLLQNHWLGHFRTMYKRNFLYCYPLYIRLFVSNLSKSNIIALKVDIYGGCGPNNCPNNGDCHAYLEQNYMFYLSFENSICEDYVTEKFWKVLNGNLVPIVLG